MEEKKVIRNIMLFSGGYDSTLLLNDLMKNNDNVTVIMIEPTFSGTKVDREKSSRRRILNYLKAKYYDCEVTEKIVKLDLMGFKLSDDPGLFQSFFWIPIMFTSINSNEDNVLYLSYIREDDDILCKGSIKQLLDACSKMRLNNKPYDIDVRWPLVFYKKKEILHFLYEEDVFLLENATTCEDFYKNHDDCSKCVPCKNLRNALIQLIADDDICNAEKSTYTKMLKNKFKVSVTITQENKEPEQTATLVDKTSTDTDTL